MDCLAEFGDDVTIDDVIGIKKAMNVVTSQPTIEAEPVRHGEWISFDDVSSFSIVIACSVCGSSSEIPKSFLLDKFSLKFNNYCPNCGAKMDKKSSENHKKYQEEETNKKAFK